jgi:hypothetical protein
MSYKNKNVRSQRSQPDLEEFPPPEFSVREWGLDFTPAPTRPTKTIYTLSPEWVHSHSNADSLSGRSMPN